MQFSARIISSLTILVFLVNPECDAGLIIKPRHLKIATTRKTTTRQPIVYYAEGQDKTSVEKYQGCLVNCTKGGVNLECGVNGLWYLNKCHRDCQATQRSKTEEQDCNPFEKLDFTMHWTCRLDCDGKGNDRECGQDGLWYDNSCRRKCFGVPLSEKTLCEKLDKNEECDVKCHDTAYNPECGVDGQFYASKCHRECMEIKQGAEGKECRPRSPIAKYWMCQDGCAIQDKKEECGEGGHWFYNPCHRECFGEKLSITGKECVMEKEEKMQMMPFQ